MDLGGLVRRERDVVLGDDLAHRAALGAHHQAVGLRPPVVIADAAEQAATADPGHGHGHLAAGHELLHVEERLGVIAGLTHRRRLVLMAHPGPALQLAAEAAHRAGRDDRLAGAARSDHHVDPGARPGGHHGQPHVAVADDRDPRAERPDPLEQRHMARPVEQHHGEVLDLHVHREGDPAEVVLRGVADVDGAARLRAHRDLVHVGDGRREQDAARLGDGGDAERLAQPAGHQADAVHGEHREVNRVSSGADGPAGEQPVVRALRADDDAARERHALERLLHHRVAAVAGAGLVAASEPASHRKRSGLGCAKQLEAAVPSTDRAVQPTGPVLPCSSHAAYLALHDPDELIGAGGRRAV